MNKRFEIINDPLDAWGITKGVLALGLAVLIIGIYIAFFYMDPENFLEETGIYEMGSLVAAVGYLLPFGYYKFVKQEVTFFRIVEEKIEAKWLPVSYDSKDYIDRVQNGAFNTNYRTAVIPLENIESANLALKYIEIIEKGVSQKVHKISLVPKTYKEKKQLEKIFSEILK